MKRRLQFEMRRRKKYVLLLVVVIVAGSVLLLYGQVTPAGRTKSHGETGANGNSSFTASNALATTARYTVNSAPTSQWLVIQATSPILSVSASDTGTIPSYPSLAGLNQTSIGYKCSQPASNGSCNSSEYLQQTGWFWDSSSHLLTVHYLGGTNVTLTVVEGQRQ
jgi:hypothetical protein